MTAPAEAGVPGAATDPDATSAAKPDRGQAEDGKHGGQSMGGHPGAPSTASDGAGINAQSGEKSGSETERDAPGMSTDKNADDTR